jgi:hypothetical protein
MARALAAADAIAPPVDREAGGAWRVGRRVPKNVYVSDEIAAQFQREEWEQEAVEAVNERATLAPPADTGDGGAAASLLAHLTREELEREAISLNGQLQCAGRRAEHAQAAQDEAEARVRVAKQRIAALEAEVERLTQMHREERQHSHKHCADLAQTKRDLRVALDGRATAHERANAAWQFAKAVLRAETPEQRIADLKRERGEARELARSGFHEKHAALHARAEAAEKERDEWREHAKDQCRHRLAAETYARQAAETLRAAGISLAPGQGGLTVHNEPERVLTERLARTRAALEHIVRECGAMHKGPVAVELARRALSDDPAGRAAPSPTTPPAAPTRRETSHDAPPVSTHASARGGGTDRRAPGAHLARGDGPLAGDIARCGDRALRCIRGRADRPPDPRAHAEPEGEDVSMDEKRKQVAAQCRAVVRMADNLAEVYDAKAVLFNLGAGPGDDLLDIVGKESGRHMDVLGDLLNGMDAVTEDDEAATAAAFAGRSLFGFEP